MTAKSNLDPALEARLRKLRLRLELVDRDTLVLKNVPANSGHFNKTRTNLLIKRSTENMPCVVCVDEDLEYTGADQALTSAFASSSTQQGWRVLTMGGCLRGDLSEALEYALGILEVDDELDRAPRKGLLGAWAENLTDSVSVLRSSVTLCRDEEIEQIAGCVLGSQRRLPLILGEAGIGKTNLLHGAAKVLAQRKHPVVSVNTGAIMAGTLFESARETLLLSLLEEARENGVVLALEQAEWGVIGVPRGLVLLREALDRGTRLIATTTPEHGPRFLSHPLESRVEIVQLEELCPSDAVRVLETLRPSIAAHHRVEINAEIERTVVERAASMRGSLPGKAVRLLDAASARASLAGNPAVSDVDVYLVASRMSA